MKKYKVCWLSAGISSFVAGYLAGDVDEFIYIDIADQHPDSVRFIHDCEKFLKKKITFLRSERFASVEDVIRKYRCVNTPYGAPCTGMLKKAVRKKWENQHPEYDLTYVWGMDVTEKRRAKSIIKNFPEFKHQFPLIDKGFTKQDAHAFADRLGLRRPVMYDMGYQNNNCIGCVKGGMGYWNKIRQDFPEVFQKRALLEREVGNSCINGVFLDELDPKAGRMEQEISQDCGIICYLSYLEKEK
ncbi:phosphoadenosine phosphosulfate reductase [Bilifractor sp. LCP19S3_H10]|uniref:phosphoadenosine phosphosulfate reductase n=1 Tax=Bilifractor sp. LCP19S3_H10 TaxID=3438736 RepID=UPI003F90AF4D